MRKEKHSGKDDVFLLFLEPAEVLQVDKSVFEKIVDGATIDKKAWDRQLTVDGKSVELHWSADFRGMLWAMPLIMLVIVGTTWYARSPSLPN